MAIIDTTNLLNTEIAMKSKLSKNMVRENYYIDNLQKKRDLDWEYRYNVVGIEEEKVKQTSYTNQLPSYSPLDVVIRSVKGERGQDLGMDWAELSFKDLKYPNKVGNRFRFDLDFEDMSKMTEEEKYYNTNIWIAINKSPINPGNSCVVRRCNGNIALVGSTTGEYTDISETRYEPCVIETELKYMNMYYNQTLVAPQSEYYITMQLNYFTNFIKVNNRLILGGGNSSDIQNNTVFKVKAVIKTGSFNTFNRDNYNGVEDIPLLVIALDKDTATNDDNYLTRVPFNAPLYKVENGSTNKKDKTSPSQKDESSSKKSESKSEVINTSVFLTTDNSEPLAENIYSDNTNVLLQGSTTKYDVHIIDNNQEKDKQELLIKPVITYSLAGIIEENWGKYFDIIIDESQKSFSIKNLKMSRKGLLKVDIQYLINGYEFTETFKFKLGGFY